MSVAREFYHNNIQLEKDAFCSDAYIIDSLCQKLLCKTHMNIDDHFHDFEIVVFV